MDKNTDGMGLLIVFIDNKTIPQMYAFLYYSCYSGCLPVLFLCYFTTCNFRGTTFSIVLVNIFNVNISSKVSIFLNRTIGINKDGRIEQ